MDKFMDTGTIASQLDDSTEESASERATRLLAEANAEEAAEAAEAKAEEAKEAEAKAAEVSHEDEYLNDNDEPDPPEAEPPAKTLDDQPVVLSADERRVTAELFCMELIEAFIPNPAEEVLVVHNAHRGYASAYDGCSELKVMPNYFCSSTKLVATMEAEKANPETRYKAPQRTNATLHRLMWLYVDDVYDDGGGSVKPDGDRKIPLSALPDLPPTWRLETRPNNFHYYYALDAKSSTPLASPQAIALWKAINERLGADTVAEMARYGRAPGSIKEAGGFVARVADDIDLSRRYSLNELAEAFNIDLQSLHSTSNCALSVNSPGNHGPLATEGYIDPVVAHLRDMRMVKEGQDTVSAHAGQTAEGYTIYCPNGDEHSPKDGRPDPWAYYSPLGKGPRSHLRLFKCFHSCKDKKGINTEHLLGMVQKFTKGEIYTTTSEGSVREGGLPEFINNPESFAQAHIYVKDAIGKKGTPGFYDMRTRRVESMTNINNLYAREAGEGKQMLTRWKYLPTRARHPACEGVTHWPGVLDSVVEMEPEEGAGGFNYVNTWRPNKYDKMVLEDIPEVTKAEVQPWYDVLETMFEDEFQRNIMLFTIAKLCQDPSFIKAWSILTVGVEGTGKDSMMFKPIVKRFGYTNVAQISPSEGRSEFMDYAVGKQILFFQEVYDDKMKNIEFMNRLKLITANDPPVTTLSRKGLPVMHVPNMFHVFLTSNFPDKAASLGHGNRRIVVLESSPTAEEARQRDASGFFSERIGWLKAGGLEKVLQHLMTLHVPNEKELLEQHGWNFLGHAPMTEAKKVIQEASKSALASVLESMMGYYPKCPLNKPVFTPLDVAVFYNSHPDRDDANSRGEQSLTTPLNDSRGASLGGTPKINERRAGAAIAELNLFAKENPSVYTEAVEVLGKPTGNKHGLWISKSQIEHYRTTTPDWDGKSWRWALELYVELLKDARE